MTTAARSRRCPTCRRSASSFRASRASQWVGLVAPKDTPAEIIAKLNAEIGAGLADPKLKARFAELGGTVLPGSPADFGASSFGDETEKWAKVIRAAKIKSD